MKNMKLALLAIALLASVPVALFAAAEREEMEPLLNVEALANIMVERGWDAGNIADEEELTDDEVALIASDWEGFLTAYTVASDGEAVDKDMYQALQRRVKALIGKPKYTKKSAPMSGFTMADVNAVQPAGGIFKNAQIMRLKEIFNAAVAAGDKALATAARNQAAKSTSQTGVKTMTEILNKM